MTIPDETTTLASTTTGPLRRRGSARPPQRRLRVQVTCLPDGETLVDLTIPTSLVDVGLRLGAQIAPGIDDECRKRLRAMIAAGEVGTVLAADDPDEGERVAVWIE